MSDPVPLAREAAGAAVTVRPSRAGDRDVILDIVEPVIRAQECYAFPADWSRSEIAAFWHAPGHDVFVAEANGTVVGTSFLRANALGGGAHVANCGFATAVNARGRGVARAMCLDSIRVAVERGFTAMQFNFVVSTNTAAVHLWQSLGFAIVGTLPGAFRHPRDGFVDVFVMFARLSSASASTGVS